MILVELFSKIGFYQNLQKFIPVDSSNQAAGIVVGGDIGRVFRKNIADDLIDRVVSFLSECIVNDGQSFFDFLFLVIMQRKRDRWFVHI